MKDNHKHSSEFLIFLLTGDRLKAQEIQARTSDCANDEELMQRLKEIRIISVGIRPEDLYSDPPDRTELIDSLIRESFIYQKAQWASAM